MNKRTALLLLGAGFAAGSVAGPGSPALQRGLGALLRWPAARADTADSTDRAGLLGLFNGAIDLIRTQYVEPVGETELIGNAINGMLTALDAHSYYLDPKAFRDLQVQTRGTFGGLGMEVTDDHGRIKVVTPLDDTPAFRAGVKAGDQIVAIDGQTTQGLTLSEAVEKLRGQPDTTVTISVRREGSDKPLDIRLTREVIHIQVVRSRLEGDVGYIRLTQFAQETEPKLREAVQKLTEQAGGKLKGFVIDLRNNPGGLLTQGIATAQALLNGGEVVSDRGRQARDNQRWDAKPGGDITNGAPLVVLINEGTASAAEILAGALQDNRRAILLGTLSFGKGSVQTVFPLPNQGAVRMTTARYYTPSGRSIQDLGITPDVEVQENAGEKPALSPQREADLAHALKNTGGIGTLTAPPRNDLPAIVKDIPHKPPQNWPTLDLTKPNTDFQLQQAIKLVDAMPGSAPVAK
ncbi:MAG: S41 family peptidase [Alphaproteobacteria bacterium]|nr:S41 family peptidase [Alphaproteobacteria bacterium]